MSGVDVVRSGPIRPGAVAGLVAALLLAVGPVAVAVPLVATPAYASNAFVEVTPSTAQPGTRVNLRASCDDSNNRQATVESEAFGRVMVRPDNGFLTGSVTIPGSRSPGSYEVRLDCPNGATATTTLNVVNMSKPTQGPATGGGGTAGGPGGALLLAGGLAVLVVGGAMWLTGQRRGRIGTGH
jgi:hypothetical protein